MTGQTSTQRTQARRERMQREGWTRVMAELPGSASAALLAIQADTGESQSQVIARALLSLPDNVRIKDREQAAG